MALLDTCRLVYHIIVAHYLARAEVRELDRAILGQQKVLRLDVSACVDTSFEYMPI